ncbi:MAG: rhomboid family intramembrane serine protease [Acidobacteriota bacterium]
MRRTVSTGNPFSEFYHGLSPAIRWILLSCVGIWFLEVLTWESMASAWAWLALTDPFPWAWQLVTYQFLHDPGGLFHVVINMFMLWMFGRELELRWGWKLFLRFYLTCGIGAALCHWALYTLMGKQSLVMGASGAVLGIAVAFAMTWPDRTLLFMMLIPMKAKHCVMAWALIDLMFLWVGSAGVANLAHLGGMATGWLYMKHGWRLFDGRGSWFLKIQQAWWGWQRKRRMSKSGLAIVEDQKEWDEWLKRELPPEEETRH